MKAFSAVQPKRKECVVVVGVWNDPERLLEREEYGDRSPLKLLLS